MIFSGTAGGASPPSFCSCCALSLRIRLLGFLPLRPSASKCVVHDRARGTSGCANAGRSGTEYAEGCCRGRSRGGG